MVSLYAKASKFSVSHSPPTLISLYKLLYYFHITVEQGSYSKLCASLVLPLSNCLLTGIQLGDAILTVGMHKCTHYSFIFLSVGQTSNGKATLARTRCFFISMLIFSVTILMHCILTTSWMRNRKLLLLWTYLDAGVIPCGNSTYDL